MGTAEEGLVESFPAGQGRSRREEKSDSCSGGDNRTVTPYNLQCPPPSALPSTSQVEQRLEPAKRAAHNVHKRLQACLQGQSGADMDKRVVSGGSPGGGRGLSDERWGGKEALWFGCSFSSLLQTSTPPGVVGGRSAV